MARSTKKSTIPTGPAPITPETPIPATFTMPDGTTHKVTSGFVKKHEQREDGLPTGKVTYFMNVVLDLPDEGYGQLARMNRGVSDVKKLPFCAFSLVNDVYVDTPTGPIKGDAEWTNCYASIGLAKALCEPYNKELFQLRSYFKVSGFVKMSYGYNHSGQWVVSREILATKCFLLGKQGRELKFQPRTADAQQHPLDVDKL